MIHSGSRGLGHQVATGKHSRQVLQSRGDPEMAYTVNVNYH